MSFVAKSETQFNNRKFNSSLFPFSNNFVTTIRPVDDNSNDMDDLGMGNASDYILIAMIVAMMICMAVCCLCLFCRSSSRFTICGYNCDVNDQNDSVANEEISELHEVVPLTPALTETHNLPDIESKLKSDPPPPQYNEVAGTSVLDRFKWRSKKKSNFNDNSNTDTSIKVGEIVSNKSKRSERKNRSSKTFHRNFGNPLSHSASIPKSSASLNVKQSRGINKKSELKRHKSDLAMPKNTSKESVGQVSEKSPTEDVCLTLNRVSETSQECKEHKRDVYDDEVFM